MGNKDRFCKSQSTPLFTKSFSALDQVCVTSHKTGKLWRSFCRNRPLGLRWRARGFRTHSKLDNERKFPSAHCGGNAAHSIRGMSAESPSSGSRF